MGSPSDDVSRPRTWRRLRFVAWLLLAATAGRHGEAASNPPVAVVYDLSGAASVTVNDRTTSLALFAWLPEGSRIRVRRASRVQVGLIGGARYELGAEAEATVQASELVRVTGPVRSLGSVPPLPQLPPLADEAASSRTGAIRIRAKGLRILWPADGASTVADDTSLRFAPLALRSRYHVEVTDEHGKVVFAQDVTSAEVRLPEAALLPGRRYYWTARTADGGTLASAEASFATLDRETTEQLRAFRAGLVDPADDRLPALAAEVYRRLGLLHEARLELEKAVTRAKSDEALRRALDGLEKRLDAQ